VEARFERLSGFKKEENTVRLDTGLSELNRVLGGGFISDEVVLLSGEPGVGKSTLLLSVLANLTSQKNSQVGYISSEESGQQIQQRCQRMKINAQNIYFSDQKDIDGLLLGLADLAKKNKPKLLVFDSLQGFFSSGAVGLPGSIAQAKEVLMKIMNFSKEQNVISLVVGHITKEGEIAGPKFLEHMADCVLFLEGEKTSNMRILRSFKNRFGSTEEVGFFEMTDLGMKPVKNPSQYFLEWSVKEIGKASVPVRQGVRTVFATVECLVVSSNLPFPKRVAKGVDQKRLELILAILKKYLKLSVDKFDIYVNVAGGLKIKDTLADLGVAAALYSSLSGRPLNPKDLFVGELGLLGNVRRSSYLGQIEKSAKRLGFTTVYSAQKIKNIYNLKQIRS